MIKLPSCTIYYILSLHKIMDTLAKTQDLKQNLVIKNSQLRFLKKQYSEGSITLNDINSITGEIKALEIELFNLKKKFIMELTLRQ